MASESVNFTINLNGTAYTGIAQIDKALGKLNVSSTKTEKLFDRLNNACFKLNNVMQASKLAIGVIQQGLEKVIDVGSESELQKMNLQTLFHGNAQAAQEMYDKIAQYGKVTPYDKAGLIDAQKTMMSFGISGEKAFESLKRIGDIAMGDKQKMQSLTLAFAQVSSAGKLSGQDLLQMINAGFNPLQSISEKTGKSMATLKDEMSKGQITVQMVEQAFKDATSEGGLFYNAIDTASQTTAGKLASMKDSIDEMLATLFMKLKPYIDTAIVWVTNAVDQVIPILSTAKGVLLDVYGTIQSGVAFVKEWWDVLVPLTAAIGAFTIACNMSRMSLMLQNAILNVLIIKEQIVAAATKAWSGAQAVLNAIMTANPIGVIIAAVAALVALIVVVIKKYDEWGAALTLLMGPFGTIINLVQSFRRNWDSVKAAFADGGILAGLKRIGVVMLDALLMPLQQLLELASRIPGVGDLAGKGAEKIESLRNRLGVAMTPAEKVDAVSGASSKLGATTSTQEAIIQGVNGKSNASGSVSGSGNTGSAATTSAEAVATGGKRSTNISISLKDLVGTINFNGSLQEKKEDVERQLAELMLRVLNMAQSSV